MYVSVPLALPMTAMVWRAPGGEATSDVKADRAASAGWGARDAGAGLEGGGGGRVRVAWRIGSPTCIDVY
jgi:hypothetical protein